MEDYDDSSGSEADELGENYVPEQSDHETDSEVSVSDNDEYESEDDLPLSTFAYFYGKNKYKWSKKEPNRVTRTRQHNIIQHQPPTNLTTTDEKDILSIWRKLIDTTILQEILRWTNIKLAKIRANYIRQNRPELQDLDLLELEAFIGLLIYSAAFKSNRENCDYLFATDGTGRDIFRCTMSKNRFLNLLRCLRFDNFDDRDERKKTDKLAAISNIFGMFVKNCQSLYNVGECATVDEMLIAFRGRSHLIIYMPNKPAKYGLKMMCLCDAKTSYFYNGYIYSGKGSDGENLTPDEKKLLVPSQSVIRLSKPLYGSNRNVTFDNWFTSIELVDALKKRDLTCTGTVKKNKRELPPSFLPSNRRAEGSTLYGFTSQTTLISHVPKKGKAVLLVSSMHHNACIDENTGKPEIIAYYNSTKGGVDELDKKCAIYSTGRRTRRWPMALFYRIVDISMVNSYIIHQVHQTTKTERGIILKDLARFLVMKHLQRRVYNMRMPREIRMSITRILGPDLPDAPNPESSNSKTRKTCVFCPPKLKRKSSYQCFSCQKHICLQCAKQTCPNCT